MNRAAHIRNARQDAVELVTGIMTEISKITHDFGSELATSQREPPDLELLISPTEFPGGATESNGTRPKVPPPRRDQDEAQDRLNIAGLGGQSHLGAFPLTLREQIDQAESAEARRQRQRLGNKGPMGATLSRWACSF